jgi:hypothetical protein
MEFASHQAAGAPALCPFHQPKAAADSGDSGVGSSDPASTATDLSSKASASDSPAVAAGGKCPFHHQSANAETSAASEAATDSVATCSADGSACPAGVTCPAASECDALSTGVSELKLTPAPNAHAAPVKWAQRGGSLYLTIPLSNVNDPAFKFTDNGLMFTGASNGQPYFLNLVFVSSRQSCY